MKKIALLSALLFAALLSPTYAQIGIISTVAGNGVPSYSGDGGVATVAKINHPIGVVCDAAGNVYFADHDNNRIRKISTTGIITTVVGTGVPGYSGDGGPATAAKINGPYGIDFDAAGNLYIGDQANNRVRKVTPAGIITTYAGTGSASFGGDGGMATAASLWYPAWLRLDNSGNVYIADNGNQRIRKITAATGIITTVAGTGIAGYTGDGGPATAARIAYPSGVDIDAAGNVYIADANNDVVRKVNTSGIISTFAGTGIGGFTGDGGLASAARINGPEDVRVHGTDVYIADDLNGRIRKVDASGIITTIAGNGTAGYAGDGGPATAAAFNGINCLDFNASGDLFIADVHGARVRKISPNNQAPNFTAGGEGSLTICVNEMPISTDALLAVSDLDMGQTLTWSIVTPPAHGILAASYTATSTGGTVTPSGTTYTASAGYLGSDMFTVQVSDGTASDIITVYVTVSYVPSSAGVISGADSICVGSSATLSSSATGGTWSNILSGITLIGGTGTVTGVTVGIDTAVYIVSTACGSAIAKHPIKVLPLANAGVISGIDSVCPGKAITLSETVTGGIWSHVTSGITTVSSTGVVSGSTPGVDTIVYTVTNSCGAAKAKRAVKVLSASICQKMQLQVEGLAGKDEFTIYPNPSNGKFNVLISSTASKEVKVTISDVAGRQLEEHKLTTNIPSELATNLAPGAYLLNVISDQGVVTQKIIVTPQEP